MGRRSLPSASLTLREASIRIDLSTAYGHTPQMREREVWVVLDGAVQTVAIFTSEYAAKAFAEQHGGEAQSMPLFDTAEEARRYWEKLAE